MRNRCFDFILIVKNKLKLICLNQSVLILRFAETIEEIFNRMFLFQILGCIFQFCLQGYQIVTVSNDMSFLNLLRQ